MRLSKKWLYALMAIGCFGLFIFVFSSHGITPSLITYLEGQQAKKAATLEGFKTASIDVQVEECQTLATTEDERSKCLKKVLSVADSAAAASEWRECRAEHFKIDCLFALEYNENGSAAMAKDLSDKAGAKVKASAFLVSGKGRWEGLLTEIIYPSGMSLDLDASLRTGMESILSMFGGSSSPPAPVDAKLEKMEETKQVLTYLKAQNGNIPFFGFTTRKGQTVFTLMLMDHESKLTEEDFARMMHSFRMVTTPTR